MVIVQNYSLGSLVETFEARASEWMLTGATLSLSVVFFLNTEMFYAPVLSGMRNICDNRHMWCLLFFIVGSIRLSVLTINGHYYRTPHFRAITAFFSAGVWFILCLSFMRNGSVMIAIVPWIFFQDCYNARRAAREAGKSEFGQRYLRGITDGLSRPYT